MSLSSTENVRWVIDNVDPDIRRLAKELAIHHDVRVSEVLAVALEHLAEWLDTGGAVPDGWKP